MTDADYDALIESWIRQSRRTRNPNRTAPARPPSGPVEAARAAHILDVCQRLGVELRRCGREWRGFCPMHGGESGSSFSVDTDQQVWYCHGCAEGGDGIRLVERALNKRFMDAVDWIADGHAVVTT